MVTVCREAGRPLPRLSEDDVLDFIATETMIARAATDRKKAEKREEARQFTKSHRDFKPGQAGVDRGSLGT